MKIPKTVRRYCPYCKKHTEQEVKLISAVTKRGSLKRGGKARVRKRGLWRGKGNKGKYSKPAVSQWKRKSKVTKKTNIVYVCKECKKKTIQKEGKRTAKVMLKEK